MLERITSRAADRVLICNRWGAEVSQRRVQTVLVDLKKPPFGCRDTITVMEERVVFGRGILSGQGHSRECRVRVTKTPIRVHETSGLLRFTYSGLRIVDSDDFPDGDYELKYEGGTEVLIRKNGQYVARRQRSA
jgi:hypothetical protein